MNKRELINEILDANPSADPGFLANFPQAQLEQYLHRLHDRLVPTLIGNADRFADHFRHTDLRFDEEELSLHEHTVHEPTMMATDDLSVSPSVRAQHQLAMDMSRRYFEPDCPDGDDPCAETMEFEPITIEEPNIDVLPASPMGMDGMDVQLTALAGQYYEPATVQAEDQPLIYAATDEPAFDDQDGEAWLF